MLKNMANLKKLRKRRKEFAEKFSSVEDKKYIFEAQFIKNKVNGFGRYIKNNRFTALIILRTAHSIAFEKKLLR
jgi:hypothetical protein